MATLARNTAWLTAAKTLSVSIYALFGLFLPRLVSIEINGLYTLMSTLLFFGSMAATFGVPTILVRTIARDPKQAGQVFVDARRALLLGATIAAVCVLLYILGEMLWQGNVQTERIILGMLVCCIIFWDAMGGLGEALFQAHEEMVWPALLDVLTGVLRAGGALGVLIFFPHWGLFGVFATFLLGSMIRGWLLPFQAQKQFLSSQAITPSSRNALALLQESMGVALFRVLRMLRNRLDSLLLGILIVPVAGFALVETSDLARGLYGQGMRVVFVFHAFTMALNMAVFPRLTRLSSESEANEKSADEARFQFSRVLRYQAWWSAPMATALFVWAGPVAGVFGEEYRFGVEGISGTTADVLRILAAAVLLDCIGGPVGMLMVGRKEMDKKLPLFGLTFALSSVVLNILLIPRWGIVGAAWASLGAAAVEVITKAIWTSRLLGSAKYMAGSLPYVALSIGIAFCFSIDQLKLAERPLLGGVLLLAVYFSATWMFGWVDSGITDRIRRRMKNV